MGTWLYGSTAVVITELVKSGLHMVVVRVAEHACDDASKRILKPSTYPLQIFLVRDQYLQSVIYHMETKP